MYVDQLGDIASALDNAGPEELSELYSSLRLSLTYDHREQTVDLEVDPLADRVDKYRVRGATHTLTTRLDLCVDSLAGRSPAD
ncbi:hypothetical protein ACQPYH_22925 [Kribbella sp. CA-245084]|uniref:hypothetical protein n=1 Tax=Kribbella sp. CA-245084 TaxID=3239940 RepID=UPI003D90060D